MEETKSDLDRFAYMQTGKPYKSYKKTINGRVKAWVINPFSREEEEIHLEGDDIIDVWSEEEALYFERKNEFHFDNGIIEETTPKKKGERKSKFSWNKAPEEKILKELEKPFMATKAMLNKITESKQVMKVLSLAEQEDKSERVLERIRARLTELQQLD